MLVSAGFQAQRNLADFQFKFIPLGYPLYSGFET